MKKRHEYFISSLKGDFRVPDGPFSLRSEISLKLTSAILDHVWRSKHEPLNPEYELDLYFILNFAAVKMMSTIKRRWLLLWQYEGNFTCSDRESEDVLAWGSTTSLQGHLHDKDASISKGVVRLNFPCCIVKIWYGLQNWKV